MFDSALWGTLVGGVIGIASSFGLESFKARRESKSLALSFGGAIGAVIAIARSRRYAEGLDAYIAHIEAGNPPEVFKVSASRDYAEIYRANVGRIGLMHGDLPALIPQFYIVINSLLEDVDVLYRGEWDDQPTAFFHRLYSSMRAMLTELEVINAQIDDQITKHYRAPSVWRHWIGSFRYIWPSNR